MSVRTVSLAELFVNGRTYEVPRFQCDYAWDSEELDDLLSDLKSLHSGGTSKHFMGAIVLQSLSDTVSSLIDGQHRFATLSLLALAVIQMIEDAAAAGIDPEDNAERRTILRRTFLGDKDPTSLTYSSRITLNRIDDGFYRDYLLQLRAHPNPARLPDSNKLLLKAFDKMKKWLPGLLGERPSGGDLSRFLNETVARNLVFLQIVVEDEVSAYTLFETLNARGVGLGPADLVKNHLYRVVGGPGDSDRLDRAWQNIGRTAEQRRLPDLLRHHFGCYDTHVRRERLFATVRESVNNREAAFDLVDDLEREAELFAALGDPHHDYWRDSRDAQRWVRLLNLFGAAQIYPVLFSAHPRFAPDEFVRLLKLAAMITFRYTVVSRLTPSELEPIYNSAAIDLRKGKVTRVRAVFHAVRQAYVDDERFLADFALLAIPTGGRTRARVRYILYELENAASGAGLDMDGDADGTIEHVLPANPSGGWSAHFTADEAARMCDRLGNVTLLEKDRNRRLGSAGFDEKARAYRDSRYAITREITHEEWTPDTIAARQRMLAERALKIWQADFQ
jgi:hypothetical protein